jgi:hypothetical protein
MSVAAAGGEAASGPVSRRGWPTGDTAGPRLAIADCPLCSVTQGGLADFLTRAEVSVAQKIVNSRGQCVYLSPLGSE